VLTNAQFDWIEEAHHYREIRTGRPLRTRWMTTFSLIAPRKTVGCFSSSGVNMRLAILGRVLSKEVNKVRRPLLQTLPAPGHAIPLTRYFAEVREHVSTTAPVNLGEFPKRYVGRKRRVYERAAASLASTALCRKDAEIKLFLKFEKDLRSDKPGRIPRCILPPSDRYLVECGRHVSPLEHEVYGAIDRLWGSKVVSKGENYRGVAKMFRDAWDSFENPMSVDVDVSKMDQSFTEETMSKFLDFVASCSTDPEYLRHILGWTLRTKVRGRSDDVLFSYNVYGTLASGMPFTSLAGVSVVTAIVWLFKEHHGINLRVVDAGDDMTIIFDRSDERRVVDHVVAWYQQFGLTLEMEKPNYHFEGIEFCQSHPCLIEGVWQMVRNSVTSASKDSVSVRPLRTPLEAAAWLEAMGLGGLASQGGVPIATARYKMMLRSSEAIKGLFLRTNRQRIRYAQKVERAYEQGGSYEWYGSGMKNQGNITDAARVSFERAFRIPPHVQRAIEAEYDKTTLSYDLIRGLNTPLLAWDAVSAV